MEYLKIGFEIIVGYFALLTLTNLLGKTQLSQITTFDFISALVIGELVGNAFFDNKIGVGKILFACVIWGLLVFGTDMVTLKVRRSRKLLEGSPSIIIHNGVIDYDALKKNHLDINQLQHLLRQKDIFSIRDCAYAILETDGSLSVMKFPEGESVTKGDLNINAPAPSLPVSLILDGEIIPENLSIIGWDKANLQEELAKLGIKDVKKVLYAEWKENTPLYVQTYEQKRDINNKRQ